MTYRSKPVLTFLARGLSTSPPTPSLLPIFSTKSLHLFYQNKRIYWVRFLSTLTTSSTSPTCDPRRVMDPHTQPSISMPDTERGSLSAPNAFVLPNPSACLWSCADGAPGLSLRTITTVEWISPISRSLSTWCFLNETRDSRQMAAQMNDFQDKIQLFRALERFSIHYSWYHEYKPVASVPAVEAPLANNIMKARGMNKRPHFRFQSRHRLLYILTSETLKRESVCVLSFPKSSCIIKIFEILAFNQIRDAMFILNTYSTERISSYQTQQAPKSYAIPKR